MRKYRMKVRNSSGDEQEEISEGEDADEAARYLLEDLHADTSEEWQVINWTEIA